MYALQRTQRRLHEGAHERGAANDRDGHMGGDMALLHELIRQLQQLAAREGAQSEHDEGRYSITEHTKTCTVARDGTATFRVVAGGAATTSTPAPFMTGEITTASATSEAHCPGSNSVHNRPAPPLTRVRQGATDLGGAGRGSAGRSTSIAVDDGIDADCVVCMQNACGAVLLPCGHGDFCFECAQKVATRKAECPICRTPIREALRYDGINDALASASSAGGGDGMTMFNTRGGFTVNRVDVDADEAARDRARANLAAAIINEALAQRINAEAHV
eukprot:g2358.t1